MTDFFSHEVVFINSQDRTSGDADNFSIDLTGKLNPANSYDHVSLLNFSCTKSYYLITNKNNKLTLIEGATTSEILLPVGNYSLSSMVTQLNTSLNGHVYTYTVTSNIPTARLIITSTGVSSLVFGSDSPYRILGFERATYIINPSLTSPNVVNFQLTNNIQLYSDLVEKSLLSCIIPDSPDNSVILYNEPNPGFACRKLSKTVNNIAQFWIINGQDEQPLELNGIPLTFTLVFYKRNNYFNIATKKLIIDSYGKKLGF